MQFDRMSDKEIAALFKGDARRAPLHGYSICHSRAWRAAIEAKELNDMIADIWRRRGRVWH